MPRYEIQQFWEGPMLGTRPKGESIRRDIEQAIRAAPADPALEISFDGIEDVSGSVADEIVCRIVAKRVMKVLPPISIVVTDANEWIRDTLVGQLTLKDLSVACRTMDDLVLLGGSESQARMYVKAVELGTFSARDLAEAAATTPQNANNWLKSLADLGAIVRLERAGREFRYSLPPVLAPVRV